MACQNYEQYAVSQDHGFLGLGLQPLLQGLEMQEGVVFVLHLFLHSLRMVLQMRTLGVDLVSFLTNPLGDGTH